MVNVVQVRVFVYRPGAIGDTILTLPAIAAIRQRFPRCHITYAGNAAAVPLLPVDDALTADDRRLLPLFEEPARLWAPFDAAFSFSRVPFGEQRDPLEALQRHVHVADWLVEGVLPEFRDRVPRLAVSASSGAELVVHPGAGGAAKRWPAGQFAQLIDALGMPATLVCGPADEDAVGELLARLRTPVTVWRGLALPELASRLAASRLFVGNDSGITHLAAAVGLPSVALYLTTEPAIWGIRGAQARCLAAAGLAVDDVAAAVRGLL